MVGLPAASLFGFVPAVHCRNHSNSMYSSDILCNTMLTSLSDFAKEIMLCTGLGNNPKTCISTVMSACIIHEMCTMQQKT